MGLYHQNEKTVRKAMIDYDLSAVGIARTVDRSESSVRMVITGEGRSDYIAGRIEEMCGVERGTFFPYLNSEASSVPAQAEVAA